MAVVFEEEPCEVSIRDGIVTLKLPDGDKRHIPIRVFRIDMERATKALADYDRKNFLRGEGPETRLQ